jgi:hypothetical protein
MAQVDLTDQNANIVMTIDAQQNIRFIEGAVASSIIMLNIDKRMVDLTAVVEAARAVISARKKFPYEIAFLHEQLGRLEEALEGKPTTEADAL